MEKLVSSAEDEAESGNLEGSKFKLSLANELKEKIKDLEDQYIKTITVTHKGEDICDVCGARFESLTSKNVARHQAHFKGNMHLFHVKVRQWIKDIKRIGAVLLEKTAHREKISHLAGMTDET